MVRNRTKACDRCAHNSELMYRIQIAKSAPWQLVCHNCWTSISDNHPDYTYGGTWKARKR